MVLVKVVNDAGATPTLAVSGDELRIPGKAGPGRWLEMVLPAKKPLSGCKLEYVPLRLTAHETGKREATLKFDAGQGTQDLGFRAEVPILFRVAHRIDLPHGGDSSESTRRPAAVAVRPDRPGVGTAGRGGPVAPVAAVSHLVPLPGRLAGER